MCLESLDLQGAQNCALFFEVENLTKGRVVLGQEIFEEERRRLEELLRNANHMKEAKTDD